MQAATAFAVPSPELPDSGSVACSVELGHHKVLKVVCGLACCRCVFYMVHAACAAMCTEQCPVLRWHTHSYVHQSFAGCVAVDVLCTAVLT